MEKTLGKDISNIFLMFKDIYIITESCACYSASLLGLTYCFVLWIWSWVKQTCKHKGSLWMLLFIEVIVYISLTFLWLCCYVVVGLLHILNALKVWHERITFEICFYFLSVKHMRPPFPVIYVLLINYIISSNIKYKRNKSI